jgi:predicted outer membrane lipoprotein
VTTALVIASALIVVVLYFAATRRRGSLVLVSWLTVPPLMLFVIGWGTWIFLDAVGTAHCGHEDYFCDHWTPVAVAHVLGVLFAIAAPGVVTALWVRERRKRNMS